MAIRHEPPAAIAVDQSRHPERGNHRFRIRNALAFESPRPGQYGRAASDLARLDSGDRAVPLACAARASDVPRRNAGSRVGLGYGEGFVAPPNRPSEI